MELKMAINQKKKKKKTLWEEVCQNVRFSCLSEMGLCGGDFFFFLYAILY